MEAGSAEGAYRTGRYTELLGRGIRAVCDLMKQGSFREAQSEMFFSGYQDEEFVIKAAGGSRMILEGKIDRIDVCEDGNERYVRVVDYKTGGKRLSLGPVYYGLSLQLVLYLAAAVLREEKTHPGCTAVPAGMYYFSFAEKLADADAEDTEEMLYEKWIKEWLLKGVGVSDERIAALSEPVSGQAAGREDIRRLIEHTKKKMTQTGSRIVSGEVQAAPAKEKNSTACAFCPYGAVCGFDRKNPVYSYRRIPEIKDQDVWEMLKEEEEDGGQMD